MGLALLISLLVLNLVNVILHSFGFYVLIYLYQSSRHKSQQLYLIHLSLSEGIMNLLESIRIIAKLTDLKNDEPSVIVEEIRQYILIVAFTGVSIVFYFDMIFITVDRLMIMALSLKYTKYWNERKAKYLLLATWLLGAIVAMTVTIIYVLIGFQWEPVFFKYFYPTVEFMFIILALLTYGFIVYKYRKKQKTTPLSSNATERGLSVIVGPCSKKSNNSMTMSGNNSTVDRPQSCKMTRQRTFRKSVFYIPVLLITTFLFLMVIPDLTYLFVAVINNQPSETLSTACWISYGVSNLVDAIIYIYFQHEVRKFILRKLKVGRRRASESMRRPSFVTVPNSVSTAEASGSQELKNSVVL